LSELVLAMKGAENSFAAIEDLTDEELRRSMKNAAAGRDDRATYRGIVRPESRAAGRIILHNHKFRTRNGKIQKPKSPAEPLFRDRGL